MRIQTRHLAGGLILLVIRVIAALWLADLQKCQTPAVPAGLIATLTGDASSYLEPMENWRSEGQYYWYNGERRVYAGRLPHYGLFYLLFRLVWPPPLAHEALALLQILVSCVADVVLASTCQSFLRSRSAYWVALGILASNLFAAHNASRLFPESLALSLVTLALCCCLQPPRSTLGTLAYGGAFALVGCLRPYLFPLVGYAVLLSILRRDPKRAVLLALPVVVLLLPWTLRNWRVLGRFVPLQEDPYAGYVGYDEAYLAYRSWMGAWGGSSQYWDRRSAGCYFEPNNIFPCDLAAAPPEALVGSYSRDRLESARGALQLSRRNPVEAERARREFQALAEDVRRSSPWRYWVVAPLRLLREGLFHSGSYWMPVGVGSVCATRLSTLIKMQQSLLYHSILMLGFLSLLVLALRGSAPSLWLFVPGSLFVVFCLVFRLPEFRYFNALQPVCFLSLFRLLGEIWESGMRVVTPGRPGHANVRADRS